MSVMNRAVAGSLMMLACSAVGRGRWGKKPER